MTTKMADTENPSTQGETPIPEEGTEQTPAEAPTTPQAEGKETPADNGSTADAAEASGKGTPGGSGAQTPNPPAEQGEAGEGNEEPKDGATTEKVATPTGSGAQTPAPASEGQAEEGGTATPADAPAEGEQPPPEEGKETPAEGEEAQATAEPGSGEGAEPPQEGEEAPKPEGEEEKPAEGAGGESPAPPDDGEKSRQPSITVEGEQVKEGEATSEGQATPAEGGSPSPQPIAEGDERPESPIIVGEKLSREGTPQDPRKLSAVDSPSVGNSPQGSFYEDEEDEEEEFDEYQFEEPQFDRDQLIERYHQALAEREHMQTHNYQLQNKLAEYFRKKKTDENRQDQNITDQEQRYLKYMANLDELRRQDAEERDNFKRQIEDIREKCQEKQDVVEEERQKFHEFKRQVADGAVNSRSGKAIPPRDTEQYLSAENRKESEVVQVRLENIKLKNKLKKKELALKSKEELAEGLHLIDFEQLKIENQTYNEKIEERNEELLKLRKKITSTVQVLTHLKEKLQFVQGENAEQKETLREVEEHVAKKRDILSRTKQARDGLRIDNHKLRQNCGLLGNGPLLRDFEERKDESDTLGQKLDTLKRQHAELTLHCNGVRRKLDHAKAERQ